MFGFSPPAFIHAMVVSTRRPRCIIAESRYVIHVNSDSPLSERRAPSQAYARLPGWAQKPLGLSVGFASV